MARVAVVSGGSRGIGAAVSKALKGAGYQVAATYAGNDEAANAFFQETGIPVYKWDVSDFDACAAGLKKIEEDLGPVDILVNNAGITRDAPLHKMKPEQWYAVINTNLNSLFNMTRPVIEGMRYRGFGRIINISSINGQKGQFGQTNYAASKSGDIGFTKALGAGERREERHRQRDRAGLYRHRHGESRADRGAQHQDPAADPGRSSRRARRDRPLRAVPGFGPVELHHRLDDDGERRPVHDLRRRQMFLKRGAASCARGGSRGDMANIFTFPTGRARRATCPRRRASSSRWPTSISTRAIETVLLLRDSRSCKLLDDFNRGTPRASSTRLALGSTREA